MLSRPRVGRHHERPTGRRSHHSRAEARAQGLSKNGYLALIAIAEKCSARTRQGSVRWDHLRDGLYGASKRTAERSIRELKEAHLVSVVRPGWGSQHSDGHAPMYEVSPLPGMPPPASASSPPRIPPALSVSNSEDADKSELDTDRIGLDTATPYAVTCENISLDGSIDGKARVGARTGQPDSRPPVEPPPRRCTRHPNWDDWPCIHCKADKQEYRGWLDASRRLLSYLDLMADTAHQHQADEIRAERRTRIAVFQRLGEPWK